MNNTMTRELTEIINSLEKMETLIKVLDQTVFEDKNFNAIDSQNLCSVLLREINYAKSKISNIETACR